MKLHHLLTLLAISLCSFAAVDVIYIHFTGNNKWAIREIEGRLRLDKVFDKKVQHETHGQSVPPSPGINEAGNFIANSISDLSIPYPAEQITLIEAPTAGEMGSALLSFPLMLPAGRLGMQPDLVVGYNSEGGNGWLGPILPN